MKKKLESVFSVIFLKVEIDFLCCKIKKFYWSRWERMKIRQLAMSTSIKKTRGTKTAKCYQCGVAEHFPLHLYTKD